MKLIRSQLEESRRQCRLGRKKFHVTRHDIINGRINPIPEIEMGTSQIFFCFDVMTKNENCDQDFRAQTHVTLTVSREAVSHWNPHSMKKNG